MFFLMPGCCWHPSPFPVITNLCTTPKDVRSRVEKIPDHHLSYEDRRGCRVATVKYMDRLGCCLMGVGCLVMVKCRTFMESGASEPQTAHDLNLYISETFF